MLMVVSIVLAVLLGLAVFICWLLYQEHLRVEVRLDRSTLQSDDSIYLDDVRLDIGPSGAVFLKFSRKFRDAKLGIERNGIRYGTSIVLENGDVWKFLPDKKVLSTALTGDHPLTAVVDKRN